MIRRLFAASALVLILAGPAFAQSDSAVPRVGTIRVTRENVFGPATTPNPDRFPYSWGNAFHVVTRESVVRDALLFEEGDPFDLELVRESERLLRRRPYFRRVRVTPLEPVDGVVDVLVETEDVWTTSVQLSYGRAGGEDYYTVGVLERNLFGFGTRLGAFISQDLDRFVRGVTFADQQLFGSRWDLFSGYGRDEKGEEWEVDLERPFFSARTRHSEGGAIHRKQDEGRLFRGGDEAVKFDHEEEEIRLFAAFAAVNRPSVAVRITAAHERTTDEVSNVRTILPGFAPLESREIRAGLIGVDVEQVNYTTERGVLTFDRDEDINLGWRFILEGGPSLAAWGATRDAWLGRLYLAKTWRLGRVALWSASARIWGRSESSAVRNGIAHLRSNLTFVRWRRKNTAFFLTDVQLGRRLDPERQFLLGGENGLRGYAVRQFEGTKKALVVLENRRDVAYDWLNLIHVGWAAFVDAGSAWSEDQRFRFRDVKGDAGVGIRFAPSRSVDPSLIRADVAYAFSDNTTSDRWFLNIGVDVHFAGEQRRKFDQ